MKIIATLDAPAAIGPYVQGKIVNGLLYASGQIPLNPLNGEIVGDSAALYQSEAGKKGIGSVVSGFADRGKPRNGKSAPVVGTVSRVTSAGRPIGGSYVPFVGRSHGQEFYEDG